MERRFIKINGIVQGVGFRPFVFNLAMKYGVKGWVNNNSQGVYIDAEASHYNLDDFIEEIKHNPPPLAKIDSITWENLEVYGFNDFTIKESQIESGKITLISPDTALCSECLEDILNVKNRRYFYPFTNCTNCGPRFSIIESIPYDRDKTTMKPFKMCNLCNEEYKNPRNRRFHAQPNACDNCGPHIYLTDSKGKIILASKEDLNSSQYNYETLKWVSEKLKEGFIFAIKGLTGFHLVCDGKNEVAIKNLRKRKNRPHKPFALMAKNIDIVKKYCEINQMEETIITGSKKPIILLDKKQHCSLPSNIAPFQKSLGVMLPYTPLHALIFNFDLELLVMTSANLSSLPLEYDNDTALHDLSSIVDYFLLHNRDIFIPVDDSVTKVELNSEYIVRRARGYSPSPLNFQSDKCILALGPHMKNTFSISKQKFIFISQHIGDLENVETFNHYINNINQFKKIFDITPTLAVCDMHPGYLSTKYAENLDLPLIKVQHHHAHIVSCMAENEISDNVIGLSFDGTGFGDDGAIWGGEFLICNLKEYERAGHISYVNLSGNDSASREPWKSAIAYLYYSYNKNKDLQDLISLEDLIYKLYGDKGILFGKTIKNKINTINSSSMGRFFDAVSSLCDIRHTITYEGQASIELEALIEEASDDCYEYGIEELFPMLIVDTSKIITDIIKDLLSNLPSKIISAKFHNTIVSFSKEMCIKLRNKYNINSICLSGGVFQNSYLLNNLYKNLIHEGFKVYTHSKIPTNDGGISYGQLIIASSMCEE